MKTVIAYIFLFIFSFQVLPVKELGKLLFKGQMTEEVHEADCSDDAPGAKIKKEPEPFKLQQDCRFDYISHFADVKATLAIHLAQQLPAHFVPDILTPPPNC
ncbi:MAG: hypothetical protein JST82_09740 [Bacteroidetes bacterium]|nr:hypothetical protein [Bacteroidota bacterium]